MTWALRTASPTRVDLTACNALCITRYEPCLTQRNGTGNFGHYSSRHSIDSVLVFAISNPVKSTAATVSESARVWCTHLYMSHALRRERSVAKSVVRQSSTVDGLRYVTSALQIRAQTSRSTVEMRIHARYSNRLTVQIPRAMDAFTLTRPHASESRSSRSWSVYTCKTNGV